MSTGSAPSERPRGLTDRGTRSAVAFLLFTAVGLILWFIVPKFAEVFEQVRVPLPRATKDLLSLMEFAAAFPVIWIAVTAGLPWLFYRRPGRLSDLGLIVMSSLGISLIIWIVLALFLPLVTELEGISTAAR